jgi:hypothetical protein
MQEQFSIVVAHYCYQKKTNSRSVNAAVLLRGFNISTVMDWLLLQSVLEEAVGGTRELLFL